LEWRAHQPAFVALRVIKFMKTVTVHLVFNLGWDPEHGSLDKLNELYQLEDKLGEILNAGGLGDVDGHEVSIDVSEASIFLAGRNSQKILAAIRDTLIAVAFATSIKVSVGRETIIVLPVQSGSA
jgi:hypothetical protein